MTQNGVWGLSLLSKEAGSPTAKVPQFLPIETWSWQPTSWAGFLGSDLHPVKVRCPVEKEFRPLGLPSVVSRREIGYRVGWAQDWMVAAIGELSHLRIIAAAFLAALAAAVRVRPLFGALFFHFAASLFAQKGTVTGNQGKLGQHAGPGGPLFVPPKVVDGALSPGDRKLFGRSAGHAESGGGGGVGGVFTFSRLPSPPTVHRNRQRCRRTAEKRLRERGYMDRKEGRRI